VIRQDIPTMMNQLNALAEVFDKKPLGEKAAMVWFDTLNDFSTEKVLSVLIGWPKMHTKFPAPAEVRKVLNDITSTQIERESLARRREDPFISWPKNERTEQIIAGIRKMLKKPKRSPIEDWRHILATGPKGSIGYEFAVEALAKLDPPPEKVERVPGEDDEREAA